METTGIHIDDAILVEQCRSGESAAMERLIVKYQNRIYNVILRMCGNPDDAAELTQETFVKVIESLNGFKGRSSFYTWLFRIAVNLTLNHCQRNARIGFRSLDAEQVHTDEGPRFLRESLYDARAADPAVLAQTKELSQLAAEALMQLDEAHRTAIVLCDIEGMSYAQMAKVFDVELGTVRSRLSRARSQLRRILETILR